MELCELLEVELPSQTESLPSFEIVSKLSNLPNLNPFDIDENLIQTINSKYYKVQELANLNANKQSNIFSLFHVNIRSLCKHFDQLHSLLCSINTPFHIIGITETKQIINTDLLINVNIDGYQLYTQLTKSSCGGTAIYVKKKTLDCKALSDLSALEDELRLSWLKLIQDQSAKTLLFVMLIEIQTLMLASLLNTLSTLYLKLIKIK